MSLKQNLFHTCFSLLVPKAGTTGKIVETVHCEIMKQTKVSSNGSEHTYICKYFLYEYFHCV